MRFLQLTLVLLSWLALAPWNQIVEARTYVNFGIRLSPGYYGPRPWHHHYGHVYPYGYPYAYPYYAPAPVVIHPAPIVVHSAPAVQVAPAPQVVGSSPLPQVVDSAPNPVVRAVPPGPSGVVQVRNEAPTRMDTLLHQLSDASETVRRDAALDLGRMKAQRAVDPLMNQLAKDASPLARDGAARALGLIGSSRGLNALIYAAQADNDRDVRHSAQFAVEVIRTNLRGN